MMDVRSVIDRVDGDWLHGHREERAGPDAAWTRCPHSDYVRYAKTMWFQKTPQLIMRDHMGFDTTVERATEFSQASDSNPDLWYYLASASAPGTGDEALKWIMGGLAAEVKTRGMRFTDIPKVLPASLLSLFVVSLTDGALDRTFAKPVFAELLAGDFLDVEGGLGVAFMTLIARPEFRAISADDLEPIIDKIIADNPEQFEKAKSNPKLVQFFVGQAMKATQGKAPPPKVIEIVNRRLGQ